MSEEDWTIVSKPVAVASKWEEEDEEDVKDNWDDDDEEDVSKASSNGDGSVAATTGESPKTTTGATGGKKKKKALKEKLAQKELEAQRPKTTEELLAEKLERQRLQEESDFALAQDAFGINSSGSDLSSIAAIQLATKEDFESFRKALNFKLSHYTRSPYFVPFLEEFFRELAVRLESDEIKKLDAVMNSVFNEKIKLQKQQTKSKKGPKKAINEIKMERDHDYSYGNNQYDEFEDFL